MTKSVYQNFIGIDVGKLEIVVAIEGSAHTYCFENNLSGWKSLQKNLKPSLKGALVVLETTGGDNCIFHA